MSLRWGIIEPMIKSNQDLTFRSVVPSDLPFINRLTRDGKGYWGYEEEELDRFMKTCAIYDEAYFDTAFGSIAESPQEIELSGKVGDGVNQVTKVS